MLYNEPTFMVALLDLTLPPASVPHPHPRVACCNRFKDMSAAVPLMAAPAAACFYEWGRSGASPRMETLRAE